MKDIWGKIKAIKNFFIAGVVFTLLVIISFKNDKINSLKKALDEKPKIEYVYTTVVDTIRDSIPVPITVEVPKYITKIIETKLTGKDSAQIAEEYKVLYTEYATINSYDNILKDDSIAYIRIKEKTQYNKIFDRELIFQDKTPVVKITNTIKLTDHTTSVVGGVEGSITGIEFGTGLITKNNRFYKVSYNPSTKELRGAVYMPIFNFKNQKR